MIVAQSTCSRIEVKSSLYPQPKQWSRFRPTFLVRHRWRCVSYSPTVEKNSRLFLTIPRRHGLRADIPRHSPNTPGQWKTPAVVVERAESAYVSCVRPWRAAWRCWTPRPRRRWRRRRGTRTPRPRSGPAPSPTRPWSASHSPSPTARTASSFPVGSLANNNR